MVRYIVVHNKHDGCYDFHCYQDEIAKLRITSITINPPKIFMFDTREEAQDFFEDYLHDVDTIDNRCRKDGDIEHVEFCTCGIIELDREDNPILFYNKRNQIFLLEHGINVYVPNCELKEDINNMNLTNKLIRRCKSLSREQRKQYIELGKYCEECNAAPSKTECDEDDEINNDNLGPTPPIPPTPTLSNETTSGTNPPQVETAKPKKIVKKSAIKTSSSELAPTVEVPKEEEHKPKKVVAKKTKAVEVVDTPPSIEENQKKPKKQVAKKQKSDEKNETSE